MRDLQQKTTSSHSRSYVDLGSSANIIDINNKQQIYNWNLGKNISQENHNRIRAMTLPWRTALI